MFSALQNCLPFIIGVTGHRNICITESSTQLNIQKEEIRQAITYWQDVIGSDTPLWIMTGLAAGADLLATEVALELQKEYKPGTIRVFGCLPMPLADYKRDFENLSYAPNAIKKLEEIIPLMQLEQNELFEVRHNLSETQYQSAIADTNYGELRNSLYLNQGLFVAKYCNVLLSLWDGEKAMGSGGTADIVMYKLGAKVTWPNGTENPALQPVSDFDGQTSGLVHHIPVKRQNLKSSHKNFPDDKTILAKYIVASPLIIGELYSSLKLKELESDFVQSFLSKEFKTLISELILHNAVAAKFVLKPSSINEPGLKTCNAIFKTADNMAIERQSQYRKYVLAIPGYCLYEISSSWINSDIGLGIFSFILLVLLSCWAVITYTANNNIKWKYQLARGVAEAMRIRGYLNMADIEPSSAPLIPRRFRLHLPLHNHAITIAELDWWLENFEYNAKDIEKYWLKSQLEFLTPNLELNQNSFKELLYDRPKLASNIVSRYARHFFYASIGFSIVLVASMTAQSFMTLPWLNNANTWLMLLVQYSLMFSGLIVLWGELAGYKDKALGYESLKALYSRALPLLSGDFTQSKKEMLLELAREAMFEHVNWTSSEKNSDLKEIK